MSKSPLTYIGHIVDECLFLQHTARALTEEKFLKDEVVKRAFVRSLEIIGEATKKLSPDFKQEWPAIAWKEMAGMRDRLIHDYVGVDYVLVWDVVSMEIPILYEWLLKINAEQG